MTNESPEMKKYFDSIEQESLKLYEIATKARKTSIDPQEFVEVKLAKNLAERVIGLISSVAPQLAGSGAIERIIELEEKYEPLDWRVALVIAKEISIEKFCKFKDKLEAMEVGIRTGFAYITLGVVSAPLEGFTSLEIKKRADGKEYFCLNYAGPVRAAGGTGAAVSVLIADYVRKENGYLEYDPTEKEILRCHAELEDYHEYVANLQYYPSKKESEFLMKKIPVEIGGDASEKYEVSSALLKDIPRIPTNKLRSGYCLIHSSCVPLKAPKLWKQLKKWGKDLGMEHWNFLEDFLDIQNKSKSKGAKKESSDVKISPDYTYIKDLVGGRPVIAHPLRNGGLRLRYGRCRTSGFSAQAINPATMIILNKFIAIGTQLKVERPGKAAAYSSCDTIDGPIVKLENGDVLKINDIETANKYYTKVKEIIYLGDVLINYGDFYDRAHKLVPAGYVEEIWVEHLKQKITKEELQKITPKANDILENPIKTKISYIEAKTISQKTNIPLHPEYTFYYTTLNKEQLFNLREKIKEYKLKEAKRELELIGIPHKVIDREIQIKEEYMHALKDTLNPQKEIDKSKEEILDIIKELSEIKIEDKAGTFIGARMGRPEKAKMRKLTGSPHTLFPVGEEGGRLRSFQAAIDEGKITENFQIFKNSEGHETPLRVCEITGEKTELITHNVKIRDEQKELTYKRTDIKIRPLVDKVRRNLGEKILPDLIKGVRGTWNPEHVAEHLGKGILRAKYDVCVNKDGTVRYDCSELPITHFKPNEIGAPIEKLKELGYTKDIHGKEIKSENQVIELKPQDVILPCCTEALEEPADEILYRTTKFVDEELKKLYGLKPFFNLNSKQDLIGHLAIGLAPHTSAGIVMRIIGFSQTQGFYTHPYIHAAMRRDADGDEACITLLLDVFLNFSKAYLPASRGSTMDAPLVLTSKLLPGEVDDMIFNMDIAWKYPLEMYEAAKEYKLPYDVKVPIINHVLGTPNQYENMGFTHDTTNMNEGVLCSNYKLLPSMDEKVESQMQLAVKIRATDAKDVARLIIEKHFIRDTKGNLRKFSLQQFRCVHCNEKYRRPPLQGKCVKCSGKVIFTISEGSVIKYMKQSLALCEKYEVDTYTDQVIRLTQKRIEDVFGKDKEKQLGLGDF
ncbi:MAG: DNA polymerase II large subunit [Candidatus Woesearchaeota archaeon]